MRRSANRWSPSSCSNARDIPRWSSPTRASTTQTLATVTGTAGEGIHVTSISGPVAVTTAAVTGGTNGIDATSTSGGVTVTTSGTVTGNIALTSAQQQALRAGQLYIQINSVKAPAPAGNLWGWILIAHETVGQDVPQQGHWFLPQYDMPESAEHRSTHPLKTDTSASGETQ